MTEVASLSFEMPVAQPFSFAHTLAFLGRFSAMTGEQQLGPESLTYAVREAGHTVGVTVRGVGDGLHAELTSAQPLDAEAVEAVRDRVAFFLGTDDDLQTFYALAEHDPAFGAVIRRLYGYHQVKFPSPRELLVWAILSQRVPMPVARGMKRSIVGHFDNRIAVDEEEHVTFPDLEQLSGLDEPAWVQLITNRRKAGYLTGAVRGFAQLEEQFLRHGPEEEVREALLALPGIGPWSAGFVMIRGLGRMGTLSPDKEGKRAASRVYGDPVEDAELVALAGTYGDWKGYWGHYLRAGG